MNFDGGSKVVGGHESPPKPPKSPLPKLTPSKWVFLNMGGTPFILGVSFWFLSKTTQKVFGELKKTWWVWRNLSVPLTSPFLRQDVEVGGAGKLHHAGRPRHPHRGLPGPVLRGAAQGEVEPPENMRSVLSQ